MDRRARRKQREIADFSDWCAWAHEERRAGRPQAMEWWHVAKRTVTSARRIQQLDRLRRHEQHESAEEELAESLQACQHLLHQHLLKRLERIHRCLRQRGPGQLPPTPGMPSPIKVIMGEIVVRIELKDELREVVRMAKTRVRRREDKPSKRTPPEQVLALRTPDQRILADRCRLWLQEEDGNRIADLAAHAEISASSISRFLRNEGNLSRTSEDLLRQALVELVGLDRMLEENRLDAEIAGMAKTAGALLGVDEEDGL